MFFTFYFLGAEILGFHLSLRRDRAAATSEQTEDTTTRLGFTTSIEEKEIYDEEILGS